MGKLILVSTPLGNLGDLSPRALKHLSEAKIILAEDTRNFLNLLRALGISAEGKLIDSFHDQSDEQKINKIVDYFKRESEVLLVSDAGSPLISDPALPLIQAVLKNGHEIDTIPGPSAVIAAMELSGLYRQPFHFFGFLPRTDNERKKMFVESLTMGGVSVFFESPMRVHQTLECLEQFFPTVRVAVVREITKKFQSVYRFTASEYPQIKEQIPQLGEFVIIVESISPEFMLSKYLEKESCQKLANEYLSGGGKKTLSKLLSLVLDRPSKEIYSAMNKEQKD